MTFEGTTEMGNPFMARQSYLPTEIKWGYQFVRCIHRPHKGDTSYTVDIAKCVPYTNFAKISLCITQLFDRFTADSR